MKTLVSKVESYVTGLKPGSVFSFNSVVSHKGALEKKDNVNHALKNLTEKKEILRLKKGIYASPRRSGFACPGYHSAAPHVLCLYLYKADRTL